MIVERTDFISVPVTDVERAERFYGDMLGLPKISTRGFPEYQLGENISVYLIRMEDVGSAWSAPHSAHIALRVHDVDAVRAELEAKGVQFDGDTVQTGVCRMAFFKDPDGNALLLHRRFDA